ncbi:MAG: hypothetical protein AB7E52_08470 [Bdellovibrionales bacterium]
MRKFFLLIASAVLALAGCADLSSDGSARTTHYILPDKAGGRLCAFQCRNGYEHCADACALSERACYNDMQAQAIQDYEAYAREQFAARAPVDLRPSDFERGRKCEPTSCRSSCRATYHSCFTECGGTIEEP